MREMEASCKEVRRRLESVRVLLFLCFRGLDMLSCEDRERSATDYINTNRKRKEKFLNFLLKRKKKPCFDFVQIYYTLFIFCQG